MKKFNAIRLLEEEKENNYLLSVNIPKKQYADKFNKLVKQIMAEAAEDGEPVCEEEAVRTGKIRIYGRAYPKDNEKERGCDRCPDKKRKVLAQIFRDGF